MKITKFTKSVIAILLSAAIVFTDGSIATAAETIEEIITSESIEAPAEEVIEVSEESPVSVEEILESLENNEEEILAEVEESNPEASLVETAEITDEENEALVEDSEASVEENEEMLVEADGETSIEEAEIEDEETPAVSEVEIEETSTDIEEEEDAELEEAETVETENAEPVEEETEIEEEEEILPEIPLQTLFTYETDEVKVIVEASEEDTFPVGAQLVVEKLEVTEEIAAAVEAETAEDKLVEDIQAYDIRFEVTNEEGVPTEVEPKEGAIVQVQIFTKAPVEEATETEKEEVAAETTVFHFDEETNTIEDMAAETVAVDATVDEGEGLAFETDHFSTYLVVKTKTQFGEKSNALITGGVLDVFEKGTGSQNFSVDGKSDCKLKIYVFKDGESYATYPQKSNSYFTCKKGSRTFEIQLLEGDSLIIDDVFLGLSESNRTSYKSKIAADFKSCKTDGYNFKKDNTYYLYIYLKTPADTTTADQVADKKQLQQKFDLVKELKDKNRALELSNPFKEAAVVTTDEKEYYLNEITVGTTKVKELSYDNEGKLKYNNTGDVGYQKVTLTYTEVTAKASLKSGSTPSTPITPKGSNSSSVDLRTILANDVVLDASAPLESVKTVTTADGKQYMFTSVKVGETEATKLYYDANGRLVYETSTDTQPQKVKKNEVTFYYGQLTTSATRYKMDGASLNSPLNLITELKDKNRALDITDPSADLASYRAQDGKYYSLVSISVGKVQNVSGLAYIDGNLVFNNGTSWLPVDAKEVKLYYDLVTSTADVYFINSIGDTPVNGNKTIELSKIGASDTRKQSYKNQNYIFDHVEIDGVGNCSIYVENDTYMYIALGDSEENAQPLGTKKVKAIYTREIQTVSTQGLIELQLFNYEYGDDGNTLNAINKNFKFGQNLHEGNAEYTGNTTTIIAGDTAYTARKNIVKNVLGPDGYPVFTAGSMSMINYFNGSKAVLRRVTDADYLFTKDPNTQEYYYNSKYEKAYLNDDNNFVVTVASDADKLFAPFNKNATSSASNKDDSTYFFGMSMKATFYQPENGKVNGQPMQFEFTGDDDVWVFIDDVLVLDLGGVHRQTKGVIDFATGVVEQSNDVGKSGSLKDNLADIFKAADKYNASDFNGNTFADYTTHTISMFYFERGAGDSNCMLKFNILTIPKESYIVQKKVVSEDKGHKAQEYSFKLFESTGAQVTQVPEESYKLVNDTKSALTMDANGVFKLKDKEQAVFKLEKDKSYYVVEVDDGGADTVRVNNLEGKQSKTLCAGDSPIVVFSNCFNKVDNTVKIDKEKSVEIANWDERIYAVTLKAKAVKTTETNVPVLNEAGELDHYEPTETYEAVAGSVVDYIDPRFEIYSDPLNLFNNGRIEYNAEKLGVEQIDTKTNAVTSVDYWTYTFTIKAKEDFLGGNLITTNNGAYVTSGKLTESFEKPAVNVKELGCTVGDGETTIFIEDEFVPTTYADELIKTVKTSDKVKSNFVLNSSEINALINNGSFSRDYYYSGDAQKIGTLKFEMSGVDQDGKAVSLKKHVAEKTGEPAETYTLKISYIPDGEAERKSAESADYYDEAKFVNQYNGATVTAKSVEDSGDYKVNVVEGTIVINKSIKSDDNLTKFYELDGDAIFTFKVTRAEDGMVYYKTLRFLKDDLSSVLSATISHLPRGTYEVEELSTLGFRKATPDGNPNRKFEVTSDGKVVNELIASFVNERERRNDGRSELTHTDVLKNSFVMGKPISGYSMADNGTEYEANTGNTNNQNTNNDDTPKGHGDVLILTKND